MLSHGKAGSVLLSVMPVLVGLGLLVAWEIAVALFQVPIYLVPSPTDIAAAMWLAREELIAAMAITALEAIGGIAVAIPISWGLATVSYFFPTVGAVLLPLAIFVKNLPVVAIAPLFILWFGNGMAPKIAIAALISFFPLFVNLTKGLLTADIRQIELFSVVGATRWFEFRHLRMPQSLLYFFPGLRVAATLSIIGAIVAEFAGADRGLGFLILRTSRQLETPLMFGGILVCGVLGTFIYFIVRAIEVRVLDWSPEASSNY